MAEPNPASGSPPGPPRPPAGPVRSTAPAQGGRSRWGQLRRGGRGAELSPHRVGVRGRCAVAEGCACNRAVPTEPSVPAPSFPSRSCPFPCRWGGAGAVEPHRGRLLVAARDVGRGPFIIPGASPLIGPSPRGGVARAGTSRQLGETTSGWGGRGGGFNLPVLFPAAAPRRAAHRSPAPFRFAPLRSHRG